MPTDQAEPFPRRVFVAGSTGSVGRQAVEVLEAAPERWLVSGLAGGSAVDELASQARRLGVPRVAIADKSRARELRQLLPGRVEVVCGPEGLAELAVAADVTLNAVVGFAGLVVTLATLGAGRRLALANKESLVAAAPVVQRARATPGAEIVPVDSEHCAIHQCLRAGRPAEVAQLVLTGSGGPFRGRSPAELARVTREEALDHPTWQMGPKISVDSSTLMNKGLEVIEAHELFGVPYSQIEVVIHRQSVVHSMVSFSDGATVAQLSLPDMRLPVGYALGWPDRLPTAYGAIDWSRLNQLDFEPPDTVAFRCLALAYEAGRQGQSAPAWLNAANEVAVAAFLARRLAWDGIAAVVEETLGRCDLAPLAELDDVLAADAEARRLANSAVAQRRAA